jgi:DNA polymerase I-like protein with 3'-5' exonuclease and polymerase domains
MRQPSLFMPSITWTAPDAKDWPDFRRAGVISLDVETRDPNLMELGPGGARGDGYLVGVSLAAEGINPIYLPIAHAGGGNLDKEKVLGYLKEQLGTNVPKVGANILYDLEWLYASGVSVAGPKWDVQVADPLLDETQKSYSLESISRRRLGVGKDEGLLVEAAKAWGVDPKSGLWQLPAGYVGPYGEADALLPLRIFEQQKPLMEAEDLIPVFNLESRLIDVLLKMRFRGVPIDVDRVTRLRDKLKTEEEQLVAELRKMTTRSFEISNARELAKVFDDLGLPYDYTAKSNEPSFTSESLSGTDHPFAQGLLKARRLHKARADFIEGGILKFLTPKNRVHPTFRATKSEDGGTGSGRFAGNKPNLQQIPAREYAYGPEIRSCYIPEDGCRWGALDYSQQEPRVTVHLAWLTEATRTLAAPAADRYRSDPNTDYHSLVAELAGIPRKPAKTLNLGAAYGMGKYKMGLKLAESGVPESEVDRIYNAYHSAVPYVKRLGELCMRAAQQRGYIKTLLGRRRHFNLYEPIQKRGGQNPPLPLDEACQFWPNIPLQRAYCHKALNAAVQGGSADMIKKAMVDLDDAGLDMIHTTIHDELGISFETEKQLKDSVQCMLDCVKLEVPLKVDAEVGPSWGESK